MAEQVKAVELVEGARVKIESVVYEDVKGGRLLKSEGPHAARIMTRTEDGTRYWKRVYVYPMPAGLIDDPLTGLKARELSPAELATAIGHWLKVVEQVVAAGGHTFVMAPKSDSASDLADKAGYARIPQVLPTKIIPTVSQIFKKGYSLSIQGPVNAQMAADSIVVSGKPKAEKSAKTSTIGTLG